jgi:tetratricopeptide (TPR) repeat protein
LVSNAKATSATADKDRLEKQVVDLTAQVDKQRTDATAIASAEQSAAQIYKMMTTLAGEERLKGIDALGKADLAKLTAFERQVLQDRALLLRKEIGAGILEKGKNAFRRQDWPETVEQLTRFLSMNPPEDDALDASFYLGNALLQSRKFEESIKPLARFVDGDKKAKNRDFAMLLLVQAYDTVGQKDKALEVTRDAVNSYPASEFRNQFLYRLQLARAAPAAAPAPAVAPPAATPAPAVPAAVPAKN